MSGSGIPNCSTREFTAPFRLQSEETQPFSFKNVNSSSVVTPNGIINIKNAMEHLALSDQTHLS